MQHSAVSVPQHRKELNEQNAREENQKAKTERFEPQGLVVQARYGYIDVVAHFVLHKLQMKYDNHPESVYHEESETAIVAQSFEVTRNLGLIVLILDEWIQVAFDHFLIEHNFTWLQKVNLTVDQIRRLKPSRID